MVQGELKLLDRIRGVVVDLDGVLYIEGHAIEGVDRFTAFLESSGTQAVYVTNNSTLPLEMIGERLSKIGILAGAERIITSATAAAAYLRKAYPDGCRVMVVGESGLLKAVQEAGMVLDEDHPEVVISGLDREITYEKLKNASRAIQHGASFVACNMDNAFPARDGISPGAGAIAAAIEVTTGRKPIVIGKPEPTMFIEAAGRMGISPAECGVIGDRLDVDILTAENAGMPGILVLSGLTSLEMVSGSGLKPDLIFQDVGELADVWESRMHA
jgi:4-nitrophenyl phosphatase